MGVPRANAYLKGLSAELKREIRPRLEVLPLLLRSTRLPFLVATVIPVLLGVLVAAKQGSFNLGLALLTLLGASLIHLGLNTANDYFDHMLGADWVNIKPTPFSGGSRVIQYGLISPRAMLTISTLNFIIAGVIGAYLALTRGLIPILGLMAIGLLLSVFYTAPPLKLAYRGVGEIAVGIGFGPVMVMGSYFVQAQRFALEPLLASIPVGILIALILYVNEIPDKPFDLRAGKKTLVVRLSDEAVRRGYAILLCITYAVVVIGSLLSIFPVTALMVLLTIPFALKVYRQVKATYGDPYAMMPAMGANIKLYVYTGILLLLGYILAILSLL